MDVAAWLKGLGLERYEGAVRANDIDAAVLPELTADDLIDIGVTSVGHRHSFLPRSRPSVLRRPPSRLARRRRGAMPSAAS
jgi:hypothetical protein